jgi:1,4-alpha-glucan branching enzyme
VFHWFGWCGNGGADWWVFSLLDTNMSDLSPMTPIISRGLAMHKMIRWVV